jgi:hypothetical protein
MMPVFWVSENGTFFVPEIFTNGSTADLIERFASFFHVKELLLLIQVY